MIRIQEYLVGKFAVIPTRSAVKKAIKREQVKVNGNLVTTSYFVQASDEITLYISKEATKTGMFLEVIYEDQDFAVINKPPGIRSSGNGKMSVQAALSENLQFSDRQDAIFPKIVHRLDRDTTGCLLVAKTHQALLTLSKHFEQGIVKKEYVAIVEGAFPEITSQNKFITNDIEGKSAKTEVLSVNVLATKDPASLLVLKLHTGRTHQIRLHLSEIGFPIVGDIIYNSNGLTFRKGLMLMAWKIEFEHPKTSEEMSFTCGIHKKFKPYLKSTPNSELTT